MEDGPSELARSEEPDPANVSREIADAILPGHPEEAGELARLLRSPTARILLPPDSELAVRLVHVQTIDRLFELQSDSEIYRAGLLLVLGAIAGFLTNIVTNEAFGWTTASWVFLGVSLALAGFFGVSAKRFGSRLAELRRDIRAGEKDVV